jgi:hypothetical protein
MTSEPGDDGDPGPARGPLGSGEHAMLELLRVGLRLSLDLERWLADHDDAARALQPRLAECRAHLAALAGPIPAPRGAPLALQLRSLEQHLEDRVNRTVAAGRTTPLLALRRTAGLGDAELDLLLLAALPEASGLWGAFFAMLAGDPAQRRPTVHLAVHLADSLGRRGAALLQLVEGGALRHQLLRLEPAEAPLVDRALVLSGETWLALCGIDAAEPVLSPLLRRAPEPPGELVLPAAVAPRVEALARRLSAGASIRAALLGVEGAGRRTAARWIATRAGVELVELEVPPQPPSAWEAASVRHALARNAGLLLVVSPAPGETASLTLPAPAGLPVFVILPERTDVRGPGFADAPRLHLGRPAIAERRRLWELSLRRRGLDATAADALARRFRMNGGEIEAAIAAAREGAVDRRAPPSLEDLAQAAREHPALRLEVLARRVRPRATRADLVLPAAATAQLDELAARVHHRDQVYEEWGFSPDGGRQGGVLSLFVGPSGTGKTLAAEVVAGALDMDLYCVDLSQIVSKYIGETEKNLGRVFDALEGSPAVLFFDEADGIFGKRTETKDAHDRYANLEVSYLLARLETFSGLAIMASNLRQNIDAAFLRRMDFVVEFPLPDTASRRLLWDRHLARRAPLGDGVDTARLAEAFPVSGANIRNAAVGGAFHAAAAGRPIEHEHLLAAMRREYEKLGKAFPSAQAGGGRG